MKKSSIVLILQASTIVGAFIADMVRLHKQSKADRKAINNDFEIAMKAIDLAHDKVVKRIDEGYYTDGPQLAQDFNEEVTFQKIRLHEEL